LLEKEGGGGGGIPPYNTQANLSRRLQFQPIHRLDCGSGQAMRFGICRVSCSTRWRGWQEAFSDVERSSRSAPQWFRIR